MSSFWVSVGGTVFCLLWAGLCVLIARPVGVVSGILFAVVCAAVAVHDWILDRKYR